MNLNFTHITDIHIGTYQGKVEQGSLNSRFIDFVKTWNESIDYTIDNKCDLALLTGDFFKTKSPSPNEVYAFASGIQRLSAAGIVVIMISGNHDLFLSEKIKSAASIIGALELPNVYLSEEAELITADVKGEKVQFLNVPYPIRNLLGLKDNEEVSKYVEDKIEELYKSRDKKIPTIFCGHFTIKGSASGTEQMSVDKFVEPVIPKSVFKGKDFIYGAIGHLHTHQKVCDKPLVMYGGSLNRIDFNEWKEAKGFIHGKWDGKKTTAEFKEVDAKKFVDLKYDLKESEDPEKEILDDLESRKKELKDAVVRFAVTLSEENKNAYSAKNVTDYLSKKCNYIHGSCIPQISKSRKSREVLYDESMSVFDSLSKYSSTSNRVSKFKDRFLKFGEEIVKSNGGEQ